MHVFRHPQHCAKFFSPNIILRLSDKIIHQTIETDVHIQYIRQQHHTDVIREYQTLH
jgi:hypothetical protein